LLRVPKGTSDYQASWIFDAEEVDEDDNDGDEEDDDEVGKQGDQTGRFFARLTIIYTLFPALGAEVPGSNPARVQGFLGKHIKRSA
jgi:hypothetical protein